MNSVLSLALRLQVPACYPNESPGEVEMRRRGLRASKEASAAEAQASPEKKAAGWTMGPQEAALPVLERPAEEVAAGPEAEAAAREAG